MADPRYPIGKFEAPKTIAPELRAEWIKQIADCPANLHKAVEGLADTQLDTRYREAGWTLRQVVHHVPDSHMNAYIRFKLALTENEPAIKPYNEHAWASLPDSKLPVEISLQLLAALHDRWVSLLRALTEADFHKTFLHPERGLSTLERTLGLYAWHGRHHTAHITELRRRMGW